MSDVVGALRGAILRGEYAPNQRLVEADLVEQYGTSRFLLRNALTQLASEGLIELQPNRGARVREISVDEAIEITEIRAAVEGVIAARAAQRIDDDQADELRRLGDSMTEAVTSREMLRYSDLNAQLHAGLRAIAQHGTATRIVERLNGQIVRHQFSLSLVPGRPDTSLPEHLAIIDAVCRRDPDAAEDAMRKHLTSVINALARFADAPRIRPGSLTPYDSEAGLDT
jgi:DNA-binding GntR family transcriptional regulator